MRVQFHAFFLILKNGLWCGMVLVVVVLLMCDISWKSFFYYKKWHKLSVF